MTTFGVERGKEGERVLVFLRVLEGESDFVCCMCIKCNFTGEKVGNYRRFYILLLIY